MIWWTTAALFGAMLLGVIVGVAIGSSAQPYEEIRSTEPLSAVGDLRRTRAPYGVSPLGRPWDDEVD